MPLPLIIGYPRSGNHWLSALLEAYFGKHRNSESFFNFTYLSNEEANSEIMWDSGHDIKSDLDIDPNRTIYLYRDPEKVLYSYYTVEQRLCARSIKKRKYVDGQIYFLSKHYKKYFMDNNINTYIKYENIRDNFLTEFKKITTFFNQELDSNRALNIYNILTKEKMINHISKTYYDINNKKPLKGYMDSNLLEVCYGKGRVIFLKEYEKYIRDRLITNEVSNFFK